MATEQTRKQRILVVDDDPDLRKLLHLGLSKVGYDVLTAENGKEAKSTLEVESVELVIIDMMMPIMDGLRFLRWLRQEAQLTIPALVFTSYDRSKITEEALASGANDVLIKPIKFTQLLNAVQRQVPV